MEHDLRKFNISAGILRLNISSLTNTNLFISNILRIQFQHIVLHVEVNILAKHVYLILLLTFFSFHGLILYEGFGRILSLKLLSHCGTLM
jgi:hypothetical protein